MTSEDKSALTTFMYWLADYKDWGMVKTHVLLAEYEAYLEGGTWHWPQIVR